METLLITRNFLKNPFKSLPYFLAILCSSVLLICAVSPEIGQQLSGLNLTKSLIVIVVPEVLSILVVLALIHGYHAIFKIKTVPLSVKGIAFYELKILPVFFVAYFFFYPITFSARYFIQHYFEALSGNYMLSLNKLLMSESYFLYLPSVLVLGYILLNVSLSRDYLRQSADYAAANAVKLVDLKTETDIETISVSETIDNENSQYVSALRVRGTAGDTFLKAEECYYFEASDHSSLVYNSNGMFRVSMSIANLAKQLDPDYFFQNNPKHIINLAYLDSFIYTEKGQYALNFKKPIEVSLTTTKSRVEALKIAFEKYRTLRMV